MDLGKKWEGKHGFYLHPATAPEGRHGCSCRTLRLRNTAGRGGVHRGEEVRWCSHYAPVRLCAEPQAMCILVLLDA